MRTGACITPPYSPPRDADDRYDAARPGWVDLLLVIVGVIEVLIATSRWGPVVSWDSLVYLDFTRDPRTAAFFSPFYPFVLAALSRPGPTRVAFARYLGAALFGATVALAMRTTRRYSRNRQTPLIAGAFVLTSWLLLDQYVKVMSDPLALVLGFTGLYLVARHAEDPAPWRLLVAAVAVGLALATRYACLPFLIAAVVDLLSRRSETASRRLLVTLLFTAVAALPEGIWLVYNLASTGGYVNREIVVHLPQWQTAVAGIQTLSTWFLPQRVPAAARFAFVGAAACGILWLVRFDRRNPSPAVRSRLATLLRRFIVIDAAFMVSVMVFVDATVTVGRRHWLPVYFASLLLLVLLLDGPLRARQSPAARRGLTLAIAAFVAVSAVAAGLKCYLLARDGAEYSGRQMQNSVLRILRDAPYLDRRIYTEDPQAIEYLTGRTAERLPSKFNPLTREEEPRYGVEMERVRRDVRLHRALIVRFAGPPAPRYPTVQELEDAESLVTIARDDSATIRGLAP